MMKINLKVAAISILFMFFIIPRITKATCMIVCGGLSNWDASTNTFCTEFNATCGCNIVNYSWDMGNGTTSNLPSVISCFACPGTYTIKVVFTCSNGSVDSSIITFHANYPAASYCSIPTNIDEKAENKLSVYPNPTSNFINIEPSSNERHLTIKNISGIEQLSKKISSGSSEVNVSFLIPGIYFIELSNGKKLEETYFIKTDNK